jgi:DNA-binding MarR family transcriptional regulator
MDRNKLTEEIFLNMSSLRKLVMNNDQLNGVDKTMPTRAKIAVLMILSDGKNKSVKEIAECFNISPSAAAQLVDSLAKYDLIKREEDKEDRRKVVVSLTFIGKAALEKSKKMRLKTFIKIFAALSDSELAEFKRLQSKIIESLK